MFLGVAQFGSVLEWGAIDFKTKMFLRKPLILNGFLFASTCLNFRQYSKFKDADFMRIKIENHTSAAECFDDFMLSKRAQGLSDTNSSIKHMYI